jgi:predicted HNH restriction endonuclease
MYTSDSSRMRGLRNEVNGARSIAWTGGVMGKRLEYTPRSKVRSALRQLFLRSRERAKALKSTGYCCAECGIKQSKAKGKEVKIEVHHIEGARLEELIDLVYKWLLCDPTKLKPLCEACHKKEGER